VDINVGSHPSALAVDQYNGYVFVVDKNSNNVAIINKFSKLSTSLATGSSPSGIVFDPVYQYLFVSDSASNDIAMFNVTGNDATKYKAFPVRFTNPFLNSPGSMALDCTHNTLWVAEDGAFVGSVTGFQLCPGSMWISTNPKPGEMADVKTDLSPQDIAYDSHTHALYVTNSFSNNVSSYETDSLHSQVGG
jgi:DNA-binding beta-propeller fold protein YncE